MCVFMKRHLLIGLGFTAIMYICAGCAGHSQSFPEQPLPSAYNPIIEDKDSDGNWNMQTATKIQLSDSGSEIEGTGAVSLDEGVKISQGGEYVISGKLSDGRIVADVENDEALKLVLNGVEITCSDSAPIYISNGDAVIVLEENTENVLTDGSAYVYADNAAKEPNACLYGDDNISITGAGRLTVNANFNNGIGTKDELRISSASITVHAVNNALKGNDCVIIQDAALRLECKGDGIKADENKLEGHGLISIVNSSLEIIAEDDGLQAESSIYIEGGTVALAVKGKKVNCNGAVDIAEGVLS